MGDWVGLASMAHSMGMVQLMANQKPLVYLVHPELMETKEVIELIRLGHTVTKCETLQEGVAIGPRCYRISKETAKLLDFVTKAERASVYGTAKKATKGKGAHAND